MRHRIRIGDIVEVRSKLGTQYGLAASVKAGAIDPSRPRLVSATGQLQTVPGRISFLIPGFASSPYIETHAPSKSPFLAPAARSALEVHGLSASSVQHHFCAFLQATEQLQFQGDFVKAVSILRDRNPAIASARHVAVIAFSRDEPTPAMILAAHRWMHSQPKYARAVHSSAFDSGDGVWKLHNVELVDALSWFENEGKCVDSSGNVKLSNHPPGLLLKSFIQSIVSTRGGSRLSLEKAPSSAAFHSPSSMFTSANTLFIHALKECGIFPFLTLQAMYHKSMPSEWRRLCQEYILSELRKPANLGSGVRQNPSVEACDILVLLGVWTPYTAVAAQKELHLNDHEGVYGDGRPDWVNNLRDQSVMWASELASLASDSNVAVASAVGNACPKQEISVLKTLEKRIVFPNSLKDKHTRIETIQNSRDCKNTDSLSHLRQPAPGTVFVIDSTTAHELDDGISVEPVDPMQDINLEDPSANWLHVHVANPSSLISPDHPIAMAAQACAGSTYLAHTYYPMIPELLSDKFFNLQFGRNVLTFSARLDSSGEIVDYRVRASVLEDVCKITYRDADEALDWKNIPGYDVNDPILSGMSPWDVKTLEKVRSRNSAPDSKANLTVSKASLSPDRLEKLLACQRITSLHLKHRVNNGHISQSVPECNVNVTPFSSASMEANNFVFLNEPKSALMSPSHSLVSEAMVIAGRVAAKFCIDRKVPILYRGQGPPQDVGGELDQILQKIEREKCEKSGMMSFKQHYDFIKFMSAGVWSERPLMHSSMGISGVDPASSDDSFSDKMVGYVRITSPLRRFMDLVGHWHIESALLGEKNSFSMEQLHKVSDALEVKHRQTRMLSKSWDKFWVLEWCRRRHALFHQLGVDPLLMDSSHSPQIEVCEDLGLGLGSDIKGNGKGKGQEPIYTCVVTKDPSRSAPTQVLVVELGITSTLKVPRIQDIRKGSIVQAKVDSLFPQMGTLSMIQS